MSTNTPPGDAGAQDPRARLAEELRLLSEALAQRAEPYLERLRGTEHDRGDCGWCPLCTGLGLLRGERPELADRLAEYATGLVLTLRAVVENGLPDTAAGPARPAQPRPDGAGPAEPRSDEPAADAARPRVQRIRVRRTDDPADGGDAC
ncbi:hypothetical protein GCM10012275_35600 [Longimycelium tulufanense]|uniref:Uncharacterized protein n=1 Tax=Longimycelium tulufanense TaxID=907463 RepID=A0A8J3C9R3_9PSEU|nr:hypothetical protein [Longimycelium tulufanense]GGM61471.1 hypothetical protein GCM10012275_35600 [Longimycelium tulufanense]